jgi:hypothetical protein
VAIWEGYILSVATIEVPPVYLSRADKHVAGVVRADHIDYVIIPYRGP